MNILDIKRLGFLEDDPVHLTRVQKEVLEKPAIDDLIKKGKLVPAIEGLNGYGMMDSPEIDEVLLRRRQIASIRAILNISSNQVELFDHVGVWAVIDSGLMKYEDALNLSPTQVKALDTEGVQDALDIDYGGYTDDIINLFKLKVGGNTPPKCCSSRSQKMSVANALKLDEDAIARLNHSLALKFVQATGFQPQKILELDQTAFVSIFPPTHKKGGIEHLLTVQFAFSSNKFFDTIKELTPEQLARIRDQKLVRLMSKKELGFTFETVANLTPQAIETTSDPLYFQRIKDGEITLDEAVRDRYRLANRAKRLFEGFMGFIKEPK